MVDIRDPTGTIKRIGDSDNLFFKGDAPSGVDISEEEKLSFFKDKNYAIITLEITSKSANVPFTILVDQFTLHLVRDKINENTEVIAEKLQNLIPQIGVLIKKWTEEIEN